MEVSLPFLNKNDLQSGILYVLAPGSLGDMMGEIFSPVVLSIFCVLRIL